MIKDLPAHIRTWSLSLAIYCMVCTGATSCTILVGRSIMFEQVPADKDASEIIEATIIERTKVSDAGGLEGELLTAHVDRVIKGSVKTDTVKILLYQGCPRAGGGHGIILGRLESDPLLGPVLIPKDHLVR
ncbi:hypothetical protein IVB16_12770 [Bradyrhizobium sp. 183]|uniref:hypothetical protein n=1 Tax=unclassified Bradyrhizobium TaxID=2631580 RepID=UPI001FFAB4EC|nr:MULTISPECIES: hypothetical protein [unclassified Bradyrhizobium]MCK1572001.1 hypothetical protein [Bradyrhizobium sp. 174]UPJ82749.1 hypothetical protein IVB17_12770 [Bradyrhizobium sp. 184]UPJ90541.1 hypothetical protein IVB16_12770 [Bradyrhizobium sp. 183]UPK15715.1 hypothetical protein IVA93_39035 [Bradyrhizobium sp. 155]